MSVPGRGGRDKCDVGIAERAERIFIILGGAFLDTSLTTFHVNSHSLIIILGYVTVLQRIYHSWKEFKNFKIFIDTMDIKERIKKI